MGVKGVNKAEEGGYSPTLPLPGSTFALWAQNSKDLIEALLVLRNIQYLAIWINFFKV